MKKIIIDTNALMAIGEFRIDIFLALDDACDFPHDIYILEGTIRELNKIKKEQRGKYKQAAGLALSILNCKDVKILRTESQREKADEVNKVDKVDEVNKVDEMLARFSKEGYLILTQDAELKRKLAKPYLTIRQKKKVVMVK